MLPEGYEYWQKSIVSRIQNAKLQVSFHVNADLLSLYWSIGSDILEKQQTLGWGAQVIDKLSQDLSLAFPEDRGYSVRNLKYMRAFAEAYPDYQQERRSLGRMLHYRLNLYRNDHKTLT